MALYRLTREENWRGREYVVIGRLNIWRVHTRLISFIDSYLPRRLKSNRPIENQLRLCRDLMAFDYPVIRPHLLAALREAIATDKIDYTFISALNPGLAAKDREFIELVRLAATDVSQDKLSRYWTILAIDHPFLQDMLLPALRHAGTKANEPDHSNPFFASQLADARFNRWKTLIGKSLLLALLENDFQTSSLGANGREYPVRIQDVVCDHLSRALKLKPFDQTASAKAKSDYRQLIRERLTIKSEKTEELGHRKSS